ncbi:MAG: AraC family transcriptional regulator [Bacillota bacterium]
MEQLKLEEKSKLNDGSFHISREHNRNKDVSLHSHNFSELVIIYNGKGKHILQKNIYPINKGDVFLIPPNLSHGYKNCNKLGICDLMFKPEIWLKNSLKELKQIPGYQGLFVVEPYYRLDTNFSHKLKLSPNKLLLIKNLLDQIYEEYQNNPINKGQKLLIHSNFINLIVNLSREYSKNNLERSSNHKINQLSQILSFIERNYNKSISVSEMADMINFSKRHFTRIFKEQYGLSPQQYIIQCRLNHAAELLKNTDLTIKCISSKCGYSNYSHFSKLFKKKYGISPGKYKNFKQDKSFK